MKFRKKPVEVEAIQFTGRNWTEVRVFTEGQARDLNLTGPKATFRIPTLEGDHIATEGDYIIRGVHGEYYACKPDIFAETYEPDDNGVADDGSQHCFEMVTRVTGHVKLTIGAESLAEAQTSFNVKVSEMDFGPLKDIDWEPPRVVDQR